jgi:single-strand DNA-binding protein
MLNVTIMTGRLVESPELRHTSNGTPVTTVRIAVRRDYVKKDGNDATDFLYFRSRTLLLPLTR